jgi:hypothetical protein
LKCWERFNKDNMGEEKVVEAFTHSYNIDHAVTQYTTICRSVQVIRMTLM